MSGIGMRRGTLQLARRVLLRILLLAGFVVAGWLLGATAAAADTGTGAVHAEPAVLDVGLAPVVADVSTTIPGRAPELPGTGRVPAAAEDAAAVVERPAAVAGDTVSDVGAVVEDTVERTVGTVGDALAPVGQVLPVSPAPAPAPVEPPPPPELPQLEHVAVPAPPAPPAPPPERGVPPPAPLLAPAAAPAGQPGAPSAGLNGPTLPIPATPPCSGVPGGSATASGSASATAPSATTGVPLGAGGDELGAGTVGAARWRAERPSTSPD